MKFGVREICDVTFKTTAAGQKVGNTVFAKAGMPAFSIDTAKTSSLEQATTTVYAQGGKGYNRLIAWEGEKTLTFTLEDALISPMGLAVLSGAGLIKSGNDNKAHVHVTIDANLDANGVATVTLADLKEETGKARATQFYVCNTDDIPAYGTVIDGSGAGIEFIPNALVVGGNLVTADNKAVIVDSENPVTFTADGYANKTVKLDFYLVMSNGVTEVEIKPSDFGGFFYIEAQTLFRREDTGLDMAAEIILPKVKVQSGFTFSMAASGDPSTFTFTMDAFPGYTMFDRTKKVMCVMQVIGTDDEEVEEAASNHTHDFELTGKVSGVSVVLGKETELSNADKVEVKQIGNIITVTAKEALDTIISSEGQGTKKWVALEIATGTDDIRKVKYNGVALTDKDVLDAESLGLPNGSFVLWVDHDAIKSKAKVFTISSENDSKKITVQGA
jgi:hypothetical protein